MNAALQTKLFAGPRVEFFAPGTASTKGSTRAFVVSRPGQKPRAIVVNDAGEKAKAWAAIVAVAAQSAMGGRAPFGGALSVVVSFYLLRPKGHSTKKGLRADAPQFCGKRPDADKLARCALDALTGIVFVDDAQIARLLIEKRYTDESAGAQFTVGPLS